MKKQLLSVVFPLLLTASAQADDFVARARVVKVEPLTDAVTRIEDACPAPDARSTDLVASLRSDLCEARPTPTPATRYRVYYEWDGQIHERVVITPPGDTVPIRVHLN